MITDQKLEAQTKKFMALHPRSNADTWWAWDTVIEEAFTTGAKWARDELQGKMKLQGALLKTYSSRVDVLVEQLKSAKAAIQRECFCEKLHPDYGGVCGFCYVIEEIEKLQKEDCRVVAQRLRDEKRKPREFWLAKGNPIDACDSMHVYVNDPILLDSIHVIEVTADE